MVGDLGTAMGSQGTASTLYAMSGTVPCRCADAAAAERGPSAGRDTLFSLMSLNVLADIADAVLEFGEVLTHELL